MKEIENYANTTWYRQNPINQTEWYTLTAEDIRYIIHNKGKRPPKKYKDWIKLVNKKNCPKSLDFYQQIFEDLSPFFEVKNGVTVSKITKEMLERIMNDNDFTTLSFRNHQCRTRNDWLFGLGPYFHEITNFIPKNMDFPYNAHDEDIIIIPDDGKTEKPYKSVNDILERNECFRKTYNNNHTEIKPGTIAYNHGLFIEPGGFRPIPELLPLWSWGKRDCFKDILFPVHGALSIYNDHIRWESKESRLVWRGSTTGTWTSRNNKYKLSHRYRFVDWAKNQSENVLNNLGITLDVGFIQVIQCDLDFCEEASLGTVIKPYLSLQEQARSKYFIVVDGNNWPFRLATYLSSNSVVFYNGIFNFWFSRHIKPYVHYIPFKPDFSDLVEKLEYAKNHDEEMKQIAQNAKNFIKEFINSNSASCYLALLFTEYLELVSHEDDYMNFDEPINSNFHESAEKSEKKSRKTTFSEKSRKERRMSRKERREFKERELWKRNQ